MLYRAGILLSLLNILTIGLADAAECLSVSRNDLSELHTEYGLVTADWSATVENQCDAPYDGTLKVAFLDEDEEALLSVTKIVTLRPRETVDTGKTVSIPAESVDDVDQIHVEIRELERPR